MDAKILAMYYSNQCEFYIKTPDGFGGSQTMEINSRVIHNVEKGLAEAKPILRPLSSMTEEEKYEVSHLKWKDRHTALMLSSVIPSLDEWNSKQFQYLLSKSFDLFGLIESGDAIDYNSQPKP